MNALGVANIKRIIHIRDHSLSSSLDFRPSDVLVSRSQTVTLAVTVWTTAIKRFVLSSPGSRVGDKWLLIKCERYRKGHESHYVRAKRGVDLGVP